jgi:hypothetical protein
LASWHYIRIRFVGLMLGLLRAGENASRASGLVSGVASTSAAAGLFLAIFALMLLIRLFT